MEMEKREAYWGRTCPKKKAHPKFLIVRTEKRHCLWGPGV
jgi:hypothetical protein